MGWRSRLFVSTLLAMFVLSASSSRKLQDIKTVKIYEIDYRGPQTHSLWPPPCSSQPGIKWDNRTLFFKDQVCLSVSIMQTLSGNLVMVNNSKVAEKKHPGVV
ncbi:hypothetical protein HPP92_024823 [Vanilla planifolia]|uniref:Uncharacterized protein n=1 Tax=Vanilla planifolia TaxID=51239 RepID=A0A835U7E9_VANPL|nr:hypothetical protein HPP92_025088 [Vanilla planifolia]KAG0453519.1 hypothetical protein HPP92_024823 [Vanilla planifolia]